MGPAGTDAASYSVDDPWSTNAASSDRGDAAHASSSSSSSSRPLTWAAPESALANSVVRNSSRNSTAFSTKHAGHDVLRQLPTLFEEVFEICRNAEHTEDLELSLGQLGKVVRCAPGLGAADVEEIINISCSSTSSHCSKEEYAVAMILIAQRQHGEKLSVAKAQNTLSDEQIDVPIPRLDLAKLRSSTFVLGRPSSMAARAPKMSSSSSTSSNLDPWAVNRDQSALHNSTPARDGLPASSSVFRSSTLRAWDEGGESASRSPISRPKSPLFSTVYVSPHPTSVHLLPDLGGFLFFRHVLYLVKTPNCAGVKRRYSDFVSLNDYLLARYPFRLLPPLPPKRLSLPHMNRKQPVGAGQQDAFLEQRRLALARYTRSIMSHPVLRKDATVLSFFTSGAISAQMRNGTQPSSGGNDNAVSDENVSTWTGIQQETPILEEGLDDSWKIGEADLMHIPVDMDEKLKKTKELASVVLERWNGVVSVFERQVRRTEAMSAESTRLSLALSSLVEVEEQTYQGGGDEADQDAEDNGATTTSSSSSDAFKRSSTLLVSNSQDYADLSTARFHALQHTLDALKNGRDVWVALKEMFKRHERLGRDRIPDLEERIAAHRKRFKSTHEEKKPGWQEQCARIKQDVEQDQRLIARFQRRNTRVRLAIWHEIARMQTLKNQILSDWRTYAKNEAVHLAATKQAAEELAIALEQL